MKNIKLGAKYYGLAYLIGTILGFTTYYINVIVMWIVIFTIMPAVFGYLFFLYLKKTKCKISESVKETNLLILFWITASFLLDAFVYIIIVPIIYGYKPNWTFFVNQSPWIWLNYLTLVIIGYISRFYFIRNLKAKNNSVP